MKKVIYLKILIFNFLIFTFSNTLFPWSYEAHRYINREAVKLLPKELRAGLSRYSVYLSSHSIDPDEWKKFIPGEKYRHYIDLDYYDEYPFKEVPRVYDEIVAKYGRNKVLHYGTVPWTIVEYFNISTELMKSSHTFSYALLSLAALGHYVADAHQPLHTTMNYDGQYTDNNGIHFRYEWYMLDRYIDKLYIAPAKIYYVKDVLNFTFNFIIDAYSKISTILDTDTKHKDIFIPDPVEYYELLWEDTRKITIEQINNAVVNLASLWYTAWVNAGKPTIPKIPPTEFKSITTLKDWNTFRNVTTKQ
ncbi:MAG: zinc dependent phospholipase C family protein [Elusimicrobiota bacterium]|nr:zinc dependent phospholipase C family protein [Elusimicrobiota bacterium]